jgi:hypothetical protein
MSEHRISVPVKKRKKKNTGVPLSNDKSPRIIDLSNGPCLHWCSEPPVGHSLLSLSLVRGDAARLRNCRVVVHLEVPVQLSIERGARGEGRYAEETQSSEHC